MLVKTCIVCGEQKGDCIAIVNQTLCHSCEQKIVHTNAEHPAYSFFVGKLRKIEVSIIK